ncbi:hypothetical protein KR200_003445, partial [Drosophila serrata]
AAVNAFPDEEALIEHNRLRNLHGVPPLRLSRQLCWKATAYAQVRSIDIRIILDNRINTRNGKAQELAKQKYLYLSDTQGKYGENLCFRLDDPEKCIQYWYDEIKEYDFSNPGPKLNAAQFTQVIWASSTELGWGQHQADNGFYYVVARYTPRGNTHSFEKNVPRPLS